MAELKYHRVVLKISGESFGGSGSGMDSDALDTISKRVARVHAMGVQLAIVVGGGNIVRGAMFSAQKGINRSTADYMGMLATAINALGLQDALERLRVETRVMTAIPMQNVAESYIRRRAIRHLEKGRVVILACGTGNPFFSTDTTAALRASEINAEVVLKATKVDGVYSADPMTDKSAHRYDTITYMDVLKGQLKVMDATAISLCMDNRLPIIVFSLKQEDSVERILRGEQVGTLVNV